MKSLLGKVAAPNRTIEEVIPKDKERRSFPATLVQMKNVLPKSGCVENNGEYGKWMTVDQSTRRHASTERIG